MALQVKVFHLGTLSLAIPGIELRRQKMVYHWPKFFHITAKPEPLSEDAEDRCTSHVFYCSVKALPFQKAATLAVQAQGEGVIFS